MNIVFIKYFFVGFMFSEIPRVSVSNTVRLTVSVFGYFSLLINIQTKTTQYSLQFIVFSRCSYCNTKS